MSTASRMIALASGTNRAVYLEGLPGRAPRHRQEEDERPRSCLAKPRIPCRRAAIIGQSSEVTVLV
eukprot:scaffold7340_cov266-Pinguiococcus_pyrenoidosus.AAC.52